MHRRTFIEHRASSVISSLLLALLPFAVAQAQCPPPVFGENEADLTIVDGGTLAPAPGVGCYEDHELTLPPLGLYFDTTIGIVPPPGTLPPQAAAFVPHDTRRFRQKPDVELQFLPSDIPPFLGFDEDDFRPYAYRGGPGSPLPWFWEQLVDYGAVDDAPSGGWLAQGKLDSLEESTVYAAHPGLVTITSPTEGQLVGAGDLPLPVTGYVRFFDISAGAPAPCLSFALEVGGLTVVPDCASGSFTAGPLTFAEGMQTITAKLTGPSQDISYDRVTIDVDLTPPQVVWKSHEDGDTFNKGLRYFEVHYSDDHGVQTPTIEEPSALPELCEGETDHDTCFRFNFDWQGAPTLVQFELTDDAGNSTGLLSLSL